MFLLPLLAVPLLYVALLAYLARKGSPAGIGLSLFFFALAAATGFWAIVQSRSSTAGIGFVFLPLTATVAGLLGLAYARWHSSPGPAQKGLGWLALLGALSVNLLNVREALATRSKNAARDVSQAAHSATIDANRAAISRRIRERPAQARAFLDSSIRANMNDRAFLIAALPNDSISLDLLDSLAGNADRGVALVAVNNPATRAETLRRVYAQNNPDYFYQALAAHPNSPPQVLRGIHRNPGVMSNLDIWFAGNPATPRDILLQISRTTTERPVIVRMLENPTIDCAILGELGSALIKRLKSSGGDPSVARMTELLPTLCPGGKQ